MGRVGGAGLNFSPVKKLFARPAGGLFRSDLVLRHFD
jgi:hypothetical protein